LSDVRRVHTREQAGAGRRPRCCASRLQDARHHRVVGSYDCVNGRSPSEEHDGSEGNVDPWVTSPCKVIGKVKVPERSGTSCHECMVNWSGKELIRTKRITLACERYPQPLPLTAPAVACFSYSR